MVRRIPPDAFDFYVNLGQARSYATVAEKFGVSKRAVQKRADKEDWSERLEKIEMEAREKSDQRLIETIEDMNTRHRLQSRASQVPLWSLFDDGHVTSVCVTESPELVADRIVHLRVLSLQLCTALLLGAQPVPTIGRTEELTQQHARIAAPDR